MNSMNDPAQWPRAVEEMASRGWWPTALAAAGSLVTILGAVFFARRRAKKKGLMAAAKPMMAAMPSMAEASDMMLKRGKSGGGWVRTMLGVAAFSLAGWGIRRAFSHSM